MAIKLLEDLPGVGPATAEKLREAGFNSIEAIAVASPGELVSAAEVGEATAAKIIAGAREAADVGGFETGDRILERVGRIRLPAGLGGIVNHFLVLEQGCQPPVLVQRLTANRHTCTSLP